MAVYLNSTKQTKPLLSTYQHNAYYNSEKIWQDEPMYDYLTIKGSYSVTPKYTLPGGTDLEYSINDGRSWNPAPRGVQFLTMGKDCLMRGSGRDALMSGLLNTNSWEIQHNPGESIRVSGDLCTLLDYQNPPTVLGAWAFSNIFQNITDLRDASELTFSATECGNASIRGMFNSSGLIYAPDLHFTTYGNNGAYNMFAYCDSLETTPNIDVPTSLGNNGFRGMFQNCDLLRDASNLVLGATGGTYCYAEMFRDCPLLTEAPQLPATTLSNYCYALMFYRCFGLINAPALPATTVPTGAYNQTFEECTSLLAMPDLSHITTLTGNTNLSRMFQGCSSLVTVYPLTMGTISNIGLYGMFRYCTSLVTPPRIDATVYPSSACQYMFAGCTSLTSLPALHPTEFGGASISDSIIGMFQDCTSLELYTTSDPSHSVVFRIPQTGSITNGIARAMTDMFLNIAPGSTVPATPSAMTNYYTVNPLI